MPTVAVSYTPPPTVTTRPEVPTNYSYSTTTSSPPASTVKAEPVITPAIATQERYSAPVPARERALQPKGSTDTSWAAKLGQDDATKAVNGLIFCVQLAAAPQPMDTRSPVWQDANYLIEVVQEANMYKYQVRNFRYLNEASNAREMLQAHGFQDAFLVAYHQGQRISLAEAKALLNGN
jgi:N-acetylmuramoyl-L-alanine amidase